MILGFGLLCFVRDLGSNGARALALRNIIVQTFAPLRSLM